MYNARPDSPPLERFEVKPLSSLDSTLSQQLPQPTHPPPPRSNEIGSGQSGKVGQRSSKPLRTQRDAVIINFLADHNRPDIAQNAFDNPLGGDSDDEAGNSSPPTRSDMTAAYYEQSPVHHLNHHGLRGGMASHPLRDDAMSSATRPRSGASAHLDLIMNSSDSNPASQSAPRLDTSQQTLAQSSIGQHVLPGPLPSASTPPPSSSTTTLSRSPQNPQTTLPSLGSFAPSLNERQLPPPSAHLHFGAGSVLPSPASDLSTSARTPQLPSIGKQFSATTPPLSYRSQPSPPISLRSPHQGPTSAVSPPAHFSMPAVRTKPLSPQSEATTPASAFSAASFQSPGGSLVSGDAMQLDGPRHVLPPLSTVPGVGPMNMVFKCKHPGCTAAPFQTQYLLNSHMNVHSSSRPHYCPLKGCPRGEGGKGFKRKNEMIRHGLVHQSPGYACPYCPEREHKYPRPDNLQRHVKVHHIDKDKDDPVLRDVLNQRLDGGSRGRRRRANS